MTLPIAAPQGIVTMGLTYDINGNPVDLSGLTICADRDLVWLATGETVFASAPMAVPTIVDGERVSFPAYCTDADGWVDTNGNAVTNWYYTAAGNVPVGRTPLDVKKRFQLTTAVGPWNSGTTDAPTIDLDVVPDNAQVIPGVTVTNDTAAALSAAASAESAAAAAASVAEVPAAVAGTLTPTGAVDEALAGLVPTSSGSAVAAALNGAYAPGGTAGNIDKPTAQGIALVQALIFGA